MPLNKETKPNQTCKFVITKYTIVFVFFSFSFFQAIDQMNQKMEEENNQLLYQMKTLINQNQELLTEALNSKDQHAETTKAYQ